MNHVYKTAADCRCDNPCCWVCVGGLDICKVCGLAEGELTTECPGTTAHAVADAVYAGKIDFRGGSWVAGVSRHTPAHYQEEAKQ